VHNDIQPCSSLRNLADGCASRTPFGGIEANLVPSVNRYEKIRKCERIEDKRSFSNVNVVLIIWQVATSAWVKDKFPKLQAFYWQAGYGAFSVSPSHLDALKEYIRNQEQHHRKESFQDEFRRLLRKYEIEFDERYVWD
jgi:hypothetical protein